MKTPVKLASEPRPGDELITYCTIGGRAATARLCSLTCWGATVSGSTTGRGPSGAAAPMPPVACP